MSKRINILFDASPIVGNKSGVGMYTQGVLESLAKNYGSEINLTGYYFNFLGRKKIKLPLEDKDIKYKAIKFFPGFLLPILSRRLGFQIPIEFLVSKKYDLLLFTNFVSLPSIRKTPQIITVHDLGCFDHPDFVQEKNLLYLQKLLPRSMQKASKIFAVSEFTKKRIIHYSNKLPEDIIVTHIPVAPMKHNLPRPKFLSGKYILFMSTLEPRKNFMSLVEAYMLLPTQTRSEYSLVLAGNMGWNVEQQIGKIRLLQEEGEQIILTGYVDEDTRASLYEHASLFVMPSFYEGFGMPLLEAMSYNLPILASNIPVFHEVAGDAAIFIDTSDISSFSGKISLALGSAKVRKSLVSRGKSQLTKYDWPDVAHDMYNAIRKVTGTEN